MDAAVEVRPVQGPSGEARPAGRRQTSRAREVAIGVAIMVAVDLVLWVVTEVGGIGPGLVLVGAVEGVSGLIVLFPKFSISRTTHPYW